MPEYKLIYFKVRGRGEFLRYILKEGGQSFTEEEVTMENWPEKKSKMPMGQVPVLEVDGKMLAQSVAIGRYLANEHGISMHLLIHLLYPYIFSNFVIFTKFSKFNINSDT